MLKKELELELNRTKLILDYAKQEIKEKDKEIERLKKELEIEKDISDDSWYLQIVMETKDKEIERLNNIIKQQDTRNSRQRIANRKLQEGNNLLKQIIGNDKKYSYGIRMGSDKE